MKVYLGARSMEAPANLSNLNFCEKAKCGWRIWVNHGLKPVVMRTVNHNHLHGWTLALISFCYREQGASMNGWHRCGKEWFWPVHGGYHSATLRSFLNMAWGSLLHPILKDKWNICGLFFSKCTVGKRVGKEEITCVLVSQIQLTEWWFKPMPWVPFLYVCVGWSRGRWFLCLWN